MVKSRTQNELLEPFLRKKRINIAKKYISKDSVVCDIGCGPHIAFLESIRKRIKRGVGIDKKIENKCISNIELRNSKIGNILPAKNEEFDHVTLLAVLEHLEYPEMILREAYRILKDGGSLIITTPHPKSKRVLDVLAYLNLISRQEMVDHKQYYSKRELSKILEGVGFRNIEIHSFEFGLNNLAVAFKEVLSRNSH